jgi:hypothetical protein
MKNKDTRLLEESYDKVKLIEAFGLPEAKPSTAAPGQHPQEIAFELAHDLLALFRKHGENPSLFTELKRMMIRFGKLKDDGEKLPVPYIPLDKNNRPIRF